ncbi:MAG: 50S ribosomal protein L11 methyltransferase [Thermodesulfobacteriota bacterium]|nr:50S ribosomal protein L11 methyltransferase [Thermodesulfobacteriota bacterium]
MDNSNEKTAIDILSASEARVTPQVLAKSLAGQAGISLRQARNIIRLLTDKGEISYDYTFGATCLGLSFAKPVRVTQGFVLTPPGMGYRGKQPGVVEIVLAPGVSFGTGRHPTTRLCLAAIDHVLLQPQIRTEDHFLKTADIGTGSGVLAIALVKAGAGKCLALDMDFNAISEAKKNIRLNKLENQIQISNELLEHNSENFDLICANLRFPTLKGLVPLFVKKIQKKGVLILSGVRTWETRELVKICFNNGFDLLWQKDEKQWTGLILQKKKNFHPGETL